MEPVSAIAHPSGCPARDGAPDTRGCACRSCRQASARSTATSRAWLRKDVVAGLVLTALLVPQGMAYAELAGLPPITGLYTSILCLLGYAVFGPSQDPRAGAGLVARAR